MELTGPPVKRSKRSLLSNVLQRRPSGQRVAVSDRCYEMLEARWEAEVRETFNIES
jgi:hypothetical protein